MKKFFPQSNKAYVQNNRSNVFPMSNIWSSFNLDFQSNQGVLRVSPRTKLVTSTASLANMGGVPVGFVYFNSALWTIAGTRAFNAIITAGIYPPGTWTENNGTSVPTTFSSDTSDLKVFNGKLFATTQTGLWTANAPGAVGTWVDKSMTLTTGNSHILLYFKKFDRLYVKDVFNTINSIDTSSVVALASNSDAYTLTLETWQGSNITCWAADDNQIWIGTMSTEDKSRTGRVYTWDGISQQVTNEYDLQCQGAVAIVIRNNVPYVMDSNGALQMFTGYGFKEVSRLPVDNKFLNRSQSGTSTNRYMHPNGILVTKNNTIQVLVNNENNDSGATINENFPSGVFEWSEKEGFVHRYSLSYTPVAGSTITDFGQNRVSRMGGLSNVNFGNLNTETDVANRLGTIMIGATYYTNGSSTTNGIFVDDNLNVVQKRGYVVTDWFESDEMADSWDVFWMSYRRFLDSSDNITVKYRNVEVAPVEAAITWVDTTHFTVLNSAVDVSQYWTEGTGGEVEITQGTGGGVCAHITNAVNNAGTWTVTIDEVATGVTTGTAKARFQKWIKIFPSPNSPLATPNNWSQFSIGSDSEPRIQVKICFTFTGNGEFYKSVITSNEDITITK